MNIDQGIQFIQANAHWVLIALLVLQALWMLLWLISTIKVRRINKRYNALFRGADKQSLEKMLKGHYEKMETAEAVLEVQKADLKRLEEKIHRCVQKVHTKRYNAFDNTGSDLSYSTALLDAENNGLVLTGIYGRDYAASYAKPIQKGHAAQALSEEEREVLFAAIQQPGADKTLTETRRSLAGKRG